MKRSASVFVLLFLVGCARQTETSASSATATTGTTTTTAPSDLATAAVDTVIPLEETRLRFLDRAAVGSTIGADGMVQVEKNTFARGERIFASVRGKEVPEGLVGRVVWLDARGKELAQEQKKIPTDTRTVNFEARNAAKWKPGKYTVQIWLGGDQVHESEFIISK